MNFQPVVPFTGYPGWTFLQRTQDAQQAAFTEATPVKRATAYFKENIADARTAADLVEDRQLLSVALGAYGLDDDIENKFFIQKILEDGTIEDDALANRLSDSRYAEFSRAFGFGDLPIAKTGISSFADRIIQRFEDKQFARAVGNENNDLRLALNVDEGLTETIEANTTQAGQWFSVMGNPPLRSVFQTALGLPNSIGSVNVDQQRDIFQTAARSALGTDKLSDIAAPEQQEKLIRLFLVRSEAAAFAASSSGSTALTLLQSSRFAFN
ncbi:DUF1217 domain-containing protein [Yoonia sp.]|uniref:DUF1217 domain-containing protein n=1 Tax=Yoonia sp. TaxID=2212373 RepID=UPI0035C7A20B